MQAGSDTAGGKTNQSGTEVDPQKEPAYWREQHPKQPYAKNGSYGQFEHAYETGYNSFFKYPGQNFDDIEDDVGLGYEQAKPGSGCHGTRCVPQSTRSGTDWAVFISPRDPDRGVREWI